ncbi:hypothetical protein GCM10020219_017250 [Nonomuraea dietziae]
MATATDGQDCLDRVLDVRPDVITLDVMMPRLDGWETASRLRTEEGTTHIKVVLITARAQEDDKRRGFGIRCGRLPHQAVRSRRAHPGGAGAGRDGQGLRQASGKQTPTAGDGGCLRAGGGVELAQDVGDSARSPSSAR